MIATLYEPFRHWSETGSVYILSDLHFADSNCPLIASDWVSPEEQIDIINRTVMKNDTFVCLGDVGNPKFIPMIKAHKKILLLGNHDPKGAYKEYFDEVYAGPLFIAPQILLSHEPVYGLPWCLNIHGHDHNNAEAYAEGCKHINLAANVCGFTPLNLGKIIKEGVLSDIDSIHRITINRAVERKRTKSLFADLKQGLQEAIDYEKGTGNACMTEIVISKEDDMYIARDVKTNVADQGDTVEEALENLKEGLELYYEDDSFSGDVRRQDNS